MQESNRFNNFFRLLSFVLIFSYVYTIHKVLKLYLKFEILNINTDFILNFNNDSIFLLLLYNYINFLLLPQLYLT